MTELDLINTTSGLLGRLLGQSADFREHGELADYLERTCKWLRREGRGLPAEVKAGADQFRAEAWYWANQGCPTRCDAQDKLLEGPLAGRLQEYLERVRLELLRRQPVP